MDLFVSDGELISVSMKKVWKTVNCFMNFGLYALQAFLLCSHLSSVFSLAACSTIKLVAWLKAVQQSTNSK
jgi:hypothetical protein